MTHAVTLKYEHTLDLSTVESVDVVKAAEEYLPQLQFGVLSALALHGPLSIPDLTALINHESEQEHGPQAAYCTMDQVLASMLGLVCKGLVKRELLSPVPDVLAAAIKR